MMYSLREAADSFVVKIISWIMIVLLVILSIASSYLFNNNSYVVKINDQEISYIQFKRAVDNEFDRVRQQLGNKYIKYISNKQNIKNLYQNILNYLIEKTLIEQYVQHLGFSISDKKLKKIIFSIKAFQHNGHFDNFYYNSVIKNMGMTPDQYVQELRNQFKAQQLINIIVNTDFILKNEIDEIVSRIFQQRVIRKAVIYVDSLAAKQKVTSLEVNNFYQKNRNIFTTSEQFRVGYVELNTASIKKNISNSEIQSYYDQHQDQFKQLQRKRYSIMQAKNETNAKMFLNKISKNKNHSIIDRIKFVFHTIFLKEEKNIVWLKDTEIPNELKDIDLKERGQFSGIIKTSNGYIVARLDDIEPEKVKPLVEVRDNIVDKIKREKILNIYCKLQYTDKSIFYNHKPLIIKKQTINAKIVKTDWFNREHFPKKLNFEPIINTVLKSSGVVGGNGESSNKFKCITTDDNCIIILCFIEHKPKSIKQLIKVRNEIIALIKHKKAVQKARLYAEKILSDLKVGKGDSALKLVGLNFSEKKVLDRIEKDPISREVFSLPLPIAGKPRYSMIFDKYQNIILMELSEIKVKRVSKIKKEKIIQDTLQYNAKIIFESLISNLYKKAKIQVNSNFAKEMNM